MKPDSTKFGILRFTLWILLPVAMLLVSVSVHAQVGINADNSTPHASSMLDVKATGLGFLAPRMSSANKPASPATGLLIYQTDISPGYYYYDGSAWQKVGRLIDHLWTDNGTEIYYSSGNVAIRSDDAEGHGLNVLRYLSGKSAVRGADKSGEVVYAEGHLGVLNGSNILNLPLDVYNLGVFGVKPAQGANGAAIYGWNMDDNAANYGGIFVADGTNTGINYAIYADANNSSTNYAGHFKGRVRILGRTDTDGAGDYTQTVLMSEVGLTGSSSDVNAIHGKSFVNPGYGIGVVGEGGYMGVRGNTSSSDYTGWAYGVYGSASGTAGTRIGVYGIANGGTINWAGYFNGSVYVSADLRIGTLSAATGYKLSVNGKIACEEVLVEDDGTWPDYVFDASYELMTLEELESSIIANNHLPGLPSAAEVEENGFEIADMQKRVLEKVEELTLHTIEQGKLIRELQREVEVLKAENTSLKQ